MAIGVVVLFEVIDIYHHKAENTVEPRQRLQNMIKQSSIVENSPHYIIYLTPDGSVSYLNPAAIKMSGYSETAIKEQGLKLLFSPEMVNEILNTHIPNALKNNSAVCEVNMIQSDGEERILQFTGFVTDTGDIGAIAIDVTQLRKLETEADKIYYDALTGIYNRRFFDENYDHVLKSLSRFDGVLSLMMIDIDNFKQYNDTYGHKAGDDCLKLVAEALSKTITRTDDFVARYGGEEFVAVLPHTRGSGACFVAEKLLGNVRDLGIVHEKNEAADCVTVSIGVATGRITFPASGENHIMKADEMLYISKQNGRNKYAFYSID